MAEKAQSGVSELYREAQLFLSLSFSDAHRQLADCGNILCSEMNSSLEAASCKEVAVKRLLKSKEAYVKRLL